MADQKYMPESNEPPPPLEQRTVDISFDGKPLYSMTTMADDDGKVIDDVSADVLSKISMYINSRRID